MFLMLIRVNSYKKTISCSKHLIVENLKNVKVTLILEYKSIQNILEITRGMPRK